MRSDISLQRHWVSARVFLIICYILFSSVPYLNCLPYIVFLPFHVEYLMGLLAEFSSCLKTHSRPQRVFFNSHQRALWKCICNWKINNDHKCLVLYTPTSTPVLLVCFGSNSLCGGPTICCNRTESGMLPIAQRMIFIGDLGMTRLYAYTNPALKG